MRNNKKIIIRLPTDLLKKIDELAITEGVIRSMIVREAIKYFINQNQKIQKAKKCKKGYQKMYNINLYLSKEALVAENEALRMAENLLAKTCYVK